MKKRWFAVVCITVLLFCITGCDQLSAAKNKAEDLYASKVEYLGDNSAVSQLIEKTGLGNITNYTIELKTEKEPYGLIINVKEMDGTFAENDFSATAVELLGLIKNLDYVEITNGQDSYTLTEAEASAMINENVKMLGESQEKLKSIIDQLKNK